MPRFVLPLLRKPGKLVNDVCTPVWVCIADIGPQFIAFSIFTRSHRWTASSITSIDSAILRSVYRQFCAYAILRSDEPGNYLCIVPDRILPTESLYLPFANTCDVKASEVISKIVLLLNDDRIEDARIMAQIEAARTEGRPT